MHERYAAEHQRVYGTEVTRDVVAAARSLAEHTVPPDRSIAAKLRCEVLVESV